MNSLNPSLMITVWIDNLWLWGGRVSGVGLGFVVCLGFLSYNIPPDRDRQIWTCKWISHIKLGLSCSPTTAWQWAGSSHLILFCDTFHFRAGANLQSPSETLLELFQWQTLNCWVSRYFKQAWTHRQNEWGWCNAWFMWISTVFRDLDDRSAMAHSFNRSWTFQHSFRIQ